MAAGLGFKTFTTGEVLTAADTNGYLMQGVLVFASSAARDAAITSPQEGQFAYLKDTNVTTYYTGSAWANLDTTGMTNPMTTTGDMVYSSSGSTPARLGIGSTGQVMTVAGGIPSWASPAGGGKVLQVVYGSSSTSTAITSTTYTDTTLSATITPSSASSQVLIMVAQVSKITRSALGGFGAIRLLRGSTSILEPSPGKEEQFGLTIGGDTSTILLQGVIPMNYLDSPATTSATTYKTQGAVFATSASCTYTAQVNSAISTIILMEIGA